MFERLTLDEMLIDLKRRMGNPHRFNIKTDDWFFPCDVTPHSTKLKYRCNKLYKAGILERQGDGKDRWGYRYRIKETKNA